MMERIDVKSFVTNGVIQITAGAVSVIFTIVGYFFTFTPNNYIGAGIWTGLFFVSGGIVTVVAGVKRSFCCVVASLTLACIGILVGVANLAIQVESLNFARYALHCWNWRNDSGTDCSDWEYPVVITVLVILIIAAFALLVADVWAIVSASRAIRDRKAKVVDTSDFANGHAKSSSIMANSIAQATTTVVSMLMNVIVLFIVAYGVQSGKNDHRFLFAQTSGTSLWVGPIFLLAAFLGFRAARCGDNSSLIAFLFLNVINVFLALFCEIVGPALALADRSWGMVKFDFIGRSFALIRSFAFVTPLVVLNSIIIVAAVAHLAIAIWGIVAAAIALHRDKTCHHCCGCGCCCPQLDEATMTSQIRYVVVSPQSMQSMSTMATLGNVALIPEAAIMNGSHVVINGLDTKRTSEEI